MAQTSKGGRPGQEYWLNEKQALFLCTKSEAPNAIDITIEMVEVFYGVKSGRYKVEAPHKEALAMIRESRLLFGLEAARVLWVKMGLPALPVEKRGPAVSDGALPDFIAAACHVTGRADDVILPHALYRGYCDWCEKAHRIPLNQFAFCRRLASEAGQVYQTGDGYTASFSRRKKSTSYYVGLRLKAEYLSEVT